MINHTMDSFCNQLNIKLPIIQAPMAGGIVTPTLIAEVNKSGGLGSLPLGYLSIDESQAAIKKTLAITSEPFAVNVFIPSSENHPSPKKLNNMLAYINKYRLRLGLSACSEVSPFIETNVDELLEMVITEGISIISVTFGMLSKHAMKMLQKKNVFVMGTATSVQEGLALEAAGCHAVIAQGYEAGGHRGGGFLAKNPPGLIGTIALIPQMVNALNIPVIASGGIMDGRGIVAALVLGASAVQMGTAFLTCDESNASMMHKHLILESTENDTCITSVFTGKPVRSFKNEFIRTTEKHFNDDELLPYPLQHQITKDLRVNANKLGHSECAGLWSGQGIRLSRSMSVRDLMAEIEKEIADLIK